MTREYKTLKSFFALAIACLFLLPMVACTVEQTEEGEMPSVDVDVKEGNMPEYDVDAAEVTVGMEEKTVEVPDVDVKMEEKTMSVPDVDVNMPDDHDDNDG